METDIDGEYTPLLRRNDEPKYVFHTSIFKRRHQKMRQFQFCFCTMVLFGLTALLVVVTAYALGDVFTPPNNVTNSSLTTENALIILTKLNTLRDLHKNKTVFSNETQWRDALLAGREGLKTRDEMEERLQNIRNNTPAYKHQKLLANSEMIRSLSRIGYSEQRATEYLNKRNKKIITACGTETINGTYKEYCNHRQILCNPQELYRSYNGTCNNLKYPNKHGVAYTPFRRLLLPDYADGIALPRKAKNGKVLPSARNVSLTVHRPYYKDDPKFTVMLAVWGQFLDHDITATAISSKKDGLPISCCSEGSATYPECFPVLLDINDPYYKYNLTCFEFVRSAPAPTCCLGPREQLNTVSSYIDGSMIYGTDHNLILNLRSFKNGSMRVYSTKDNRTLLPMSTNLNDGCNRSDEAKKGRYCFVTGDTRANENLHLTSMHLLWLRQHNLIANKLSNLNPRWNDERIYQETRKILIAQIQHITYNEFLPSILGNHLMEIHELSPKRNGYFDKYNDSLDATISNAFAASAFRFAHTLIPNLMKVLTKNNNSNPEYIQMHKMLLDPFRLYDPYEMDKAIRGALNTRIQASDPYFASELTQHLFEQAVEQQNNSRICGLDLVTLNIQRGRDHGLPGYAIWREHCGLLRPRTFGQLAGVIDDESLNYISEIYSDPDDVDLYTGAVSEKPLEGSIIGPTLTCIIQDQFIRLKKGDRFWYENPFKPHSFTIKQLNEIRGTLLAKIICENSDDVNLIQRYVMESADEKNKLIPCKDIPQINLTYWIDEKLPRVRFSENNLNVRIMN